MSMKITNNNTSYVNTLVSDETKKNEQTKNNTVPEKNTAVKKSSSAAVSGINYLNELEKKISGTAFHIGTVSYGQTYGNAKDNNFVVHPKYLAKLGESEEERAKFEDSVKFLNDYSNSFRAQMAASGREVVSEGWFCDENGNWGGWTVTKGTNRKSLTQQLQEKIDELNKEKSQKKAEQKKDAEKKAAVKAKEDLAEKKKAEKEEIKKQAEEQLKEHFGEKFTELTIYNENDINESGYTQNSKDTGVILNIEA